MITSPSNPRVRAAAALHKRSERERTGHFLIEGPNEIKLAQVAGVAIEELLVEEGTEVPSSLGGVPSLTLGSEAFARVGYGLHGIVATARRPAFGLDAFQPSRPELVLMVEAVEKPGNLGAMLRSADGTGAGVLIADEVTDLTNPNVVRASLGTVFTVPLAQADPESAVSWLSGRSVPLVAATVNGGLQPWEVDFTGPVAIAIGSEHHGLSPLLVGLAEQRVRIPMSGTVDSLNASASAAILLYEAVRQRSGR